MEYLLVQGMAPVGHNAAEQLCRGTAHIALPIRQHFEEHRNVGLHLALGQPSFHFLWKKWD